MNLFTEKKQTHRQKTNLRLPEGKELGRDKLGIWDEQIHATTCKTDKQQGLSVQYRELYSIPCNNLV